VLGVDHSLYDGALRSDKPPGGPILGVPFYLAGRVLGFRSAVHLRGTGDLGMWWQTLWGAMVPFAALVALMYATASRFAPRRALHAALALSFGTLMLPHAVNLYGHALAGLFAFGAWRVLDDAEGRRGRLVLAGALAASAVAVEYHTAIVLIALAVIAAVRWRRRALWAALGVVPPAVIAMVYQTAAFGRPWRVPYGFYGGTVGHSVASGGGYSVPSPRQFADIVVGVHGLLFASPIVIVAVAAAVVVARRATSDVRTHALLALGVFVPYWVLIAGWSGTPILEQPGPRYLIPTLPFLAVPLALVWERARTIALVTALWGAAVMIAGAVTSHLVAPNDPPWHVYFQRVAHREFASTIWSMLAGRAGIVCWIATVGAAAWVLARARRAEDEQMFGTASPAGVPWRVDERHDHHQGRP
jgi:hypothetical protein